MLYIKDVHHHLSPLKKWRQWTCLTQSCCNTSACEKHNLCKAQNKGCQCSKTLCLKQSLYFLVILWISNYGWTQLGSSAGVITATPVAVVTLQVDWG